MTKWVSGSTTATYKYNGDSLRQSKTVGTTTTNQLWDVAEGVPLLVQDGTMRYLTGPGGLPIEQIDGSNTALYYYQDQLGSTRGLLNSSGTTMATYSYDPYGNVTAKTGTSTTPFQYAVQYTDSESGLQYLRSRYYDPATEQFLTVDPVVGITGEAYNYTGGGPLNFIDPLGLDCGFLHLRCAASAAGHLASYAKTPAHWVLDVIALPPYAVYYSTYEVQKRIPDSPYTVAGKAAMTLVAAQGLAWDIGLDWLKGHTVAHEQCNDEGIKAGVLPRFLFNGGPKT